MKIDIKAEEFQITNEIHRKHLPINLKVFAFGSRTNFTTRRASDLDLAIDVGRNLELGEQANLKEDFDELNLSCRVDLIDLDSITVEFLKMIKDQLVQIILREYLLISFWFHFQ